MLLADVEEWHQRTLYLHQFFGIFCVGIFQMFERTTWVNVVSGVYSHLLAVECCHVGSMRREVHISNKRSVVAVGLEPVTYVLHVLGLAFALRGEAYQFAASIDDALRLRHRSLGVVGVCGSHRLYPDGVVAADGDVTHMCYRCLSALCHILLTLNYKL